MSWSEYVARVTKGDNNSQIAEKLGVSGPTIGRWLDGKIRVPDSGQAARLARVYGRPVLEAFVAAGYLSDEEAQVQPSGIPDLNDLDDDQLVDEVRRRLERSGEGHVQQRPAPIVAGPAQTLAEARAGLEQLVAEAATPSERARYQAAIEALDQTPEPPDQVEAGAS